MNGVSGVKFQGSECNAEGSRFLGDLGLRGYGFRA
jgi:hypothetical protein